MRRFSPENLSLMEFRTERDYEVCAKIRAEHPLLSEHGYQFRRELHPADDVALLHQRGPEKPASGNLPIFEGKMVFQYENGFAPGTYYGVEKEVHEELRRKEIYRIAQFVRQTKAKTLEGNPIPQSKDELLSAIEKVDRKSTRLNSSH